MEDEYYQKAKEIQEKYFRTSELTNEEFFDYYWNKAMASLGKSFGEQNPKIKKRLERKYETALGRPKTLLVQNHYQLLADSHKKRIETTGQLIDRRKKVLVEAMKLGALDYPI